jgi:hypothetical protein
MIGSVACSAILPFSFFLTKFNFCVLQQFVTYVDDPPNMTEYDSSSDAYEKYIATLDTISNVTEYGFPLEAHEKYMATQEYISSVAEYEFSPEAYEKYMATQIRISNWVDAVAQSIRTPSPSIPQYPSDHYQHRSRPNYSHQQTHPQTHPLSNSALRPHSREQAQYYRENYRPL